MTDPCCDPLIGRHLCDYHLEAPLGVGGMGAVYRATNTRLGNQVAVKVLAAHLAADQEYLGRFEREARSLAQLNHPNIVPLHDFGDSDGLRYLVMAYMDRGSLKDRIQTHGRLAPTEVVSIVRDVLKGLAHAHGKGFVHRDIKPSNILLDDQGNARLVDFGLVKQTGDAGLSLTLTGEAMGTPHYMAPEQWDNAPPDPRMDLWAVGVTAYHALTGQVPFGGTGPTQIVKAISLHEPAPLKAHGLTAFPALQAFLDRLLAKEPQDRFASADAALAALDELATGKQSAPPEASGDALDRTVKARPGVVGGAPPRARPGGGPRARGSRPPSRAGARVLVVFLLLAGLGGVGAGGWWWWQQVLADAARPQVVAGAVRLQRQGGRATADRIAPAQPVRHRDRSEVEHLPSWAVSGAADEYGRWAILQVGEVQQRLRWISPGRFQMGSPSHESERYDDERQHAVRLTRGYWLADTECTQGLWQAVMGGNPSRFTGDARRPVEKVSWEDCQKFLRKLNTKIPGLNVRLPTEAEWEYACRAGTTTAYAGDLDDMGWYDGNGGGTTHPVADKSPNAWGLYDMYGNVWEWCQDWYADYPRGAVSDPSGPASGSCRVSRGGSWLNSAGICRSAYRNRLEPGARYSALGFRFSAQSTSPGAGGP